MQPKISTGSRPFRLNRYMRCSNSFWLCALVLGMLCACSSYHHQYRAHAQSLVPDPELHFVEADDYGWLWEPQQALSALEAVRSSQSTDTLVVVFVAGWHHLTKCCDDNVEGFKEVLTRLRGELQQKMYQQAREQIHAGSKQPPVHVIGVYIGWRGRSLPGLLDYFTFWGRKSAAQRVGDGDVREFLIDLRNLYEQHAGMSHGGPAQHLLGLVTIGHSFGGQVVLQATSSFIEEELMLRGAPPAYLRIPVAPGSGPQLADVVHGYGDLVVLINPAVEAAAYQRLHALGMSLRYSQAQTPMMLTLSANNDGPRKTFFPLGRIAGEVFTSKPHIADTRERDMERKALGFTEEQVTHTLKPVDSQSRLQSKKMSHPVNPPCEGHDHCDFDWFSWKQDVVSHGKPDTLSAASCSSEVVSAIDHHDFSSSTVFANVELDPKKGSIPHQALIVAATDPNVIDGHNGMFSEPLLDFLTRYIGFVEARRFLPLVGDAGCTAAGGS